jgi:hypothetical protein
VELYLFFPYPTYSPIRAVVKTARAYNKKTMFIDSSASKPLDKNLPHI